MILDGYGTGSFANSYKLFCLHNNIVYPSLIFANKESTSVMGIAISIDLRKIFFDNGSLVLNYDYNFGYYCYNCDIKEPEYVSFGNTKSCYFKFSFDTNLKRFIIKEQSCSKQIQAIMMDNKQDYPFNYLIQPFAKEMKQKLLNFDTKLEDKKGIIDFFAKY